MIIIPRPSQRWDGSHKNSTENCDNCNYYRLIELRDLCGGGKAFKYLTRVEKPGKCNMKNKKIKDRSMHYLDEVLSNPENYKKLTFTQLKINFN